MTISKRLRFEILRRDGFTCRYCGAEASESKLQIDHVVPVTFGGTDTPDNLVAACAECNSGKSSVPLNANFVAEVDPVKVDIAEVIKNVGARRVAEIEEREKMLNFLWDMWSAEPHLPAVPENFEEVISNWLRLGLPFEVIQDYIMELGHEPAGSRESMWKMFVTRCWNELYKIRREAEEEARQGGNH